MSEKKEILVTGGAGFIGGHLADRLVADGHRVKVLDDLSRGTTNNVPLRAELTIGNIRDPAATDYLVKKSDVVFHLAALARIRPSIQNLEMYHETNVNGTLKLLEACRKYGKKIIFASSSSIFGNQELPYHEETAKDPKSPYALQKLIGEYYLKLYGQLYGLDYSIVRYFNVYGERQLTEGPYACVVGIFKEQAEQGKPLTILGDGTQRRDFTYVGDAVDATVRCLEGPAYQQTFNIGKGDNRSVQEIADLISPNQVYLPAVEGEARETLCDNTKARQVLGWEPKTEVEEWLAS